MIAEAAAHAASHALRLAFTPAARAFDRALDAPERAQRDVEAAIARDLAKTAYGRHYGVRGPGDVRARLPIVTWDDLAPWLDEQRRTERAIVTPRKVRFYEKTSGSSGASKLVPYDDALRRAFARTFAVWAHDLLARGPRLTRARMYFSISPAFTHEGATEGGVPIGLDDDAEYLGPLLRRALDPFFVRAPGAAQERDADAFKRKVARALVRERDLSIVSVWNPSFWLVLLDAIREQRHALARDVDDAAGRDALVAGGDVRFDRLWPHLAILSCWDAAAAARGAAHLRALFPHALVQGKGLLATEAPMTVPQIGAPAPVPLLTDVLFELVEDARDPRGGTRLLHEAEEGRTYGLVISHRGGLVRYAIGDRVRVVGAHRGTPCLAFVGRGDTTSDLVGEKLHEDFVTGVLDALPVPAIFRALAPSRVPHDHYVLVLDRAPADVGALATALDRALRAAHHYAIARALGQLAAPRVVVAPNADEAVRAHAQERGIRWGDVKHRALVTRDAEGWLAAIDRSADVRMERTT